MKKTKSREISLDMIHNVKPLMYKELLLAELRIVEVNGLSVHSKAAMVRVDKLNVKGLRFLSELLFPVNPQIIINFHMEILNETIDLKGTIIWSQREESLNLFEVVFNMDEIMKAKLVVMLGNLVKRYMPLHLKAEYYYHYFSESTYDFNNSRINLFL
jgi:hypothetical protein